MSGNILSLNKKNYRRKRDSQSHRHTETEMGKEWRSIREHKQQPITLFVRGLVKLLLLPSPKKNDWRFLQNGKEGLSLLSPEEQVET